MKTFFCLPTSRIHMMKTSWRATRCTVISAFVTDCVLSPHCLCFIRPPILLFFFQFPHCFLYYSACFSYKWSHVREPRRARDVCRRPSCLVHPWSRHWSRPPWYLFRGKHLQEAEHNTRHTECVPSYHGCCHNGTKHTWLVICTLRFMFPSSSDTQTKIFPL